MESKQMAGRRTEDLDDEDSLYTDSVLREEDSIPLADDDPSALLDESINDLLHEDLKKANEWRKKVDFESLDSIPSMLSDRSEGGGHISDHMNRMCLDPDYSPDEQEEKARVIAQVLELQNTLEDLTSRVDKVKEENLKLKSENSVLGQYIENLMQASQVFQAVSPKSRRKHRPPSGNLTNVIRCTARAVRGAVGGPQQQPK